MNLPLTYNSKLKLVGQLCLMTWLRRRRVTDITPLLGTFVIVLLEAHAVGIIVDNNSGICLTH